MHDIFLHHVTDELEGSGMCMCTGIDMGMGTGMGIGMGMSMDMVFAGGMSMPHVRIGMCMSHRSLSYISRSIASHVH